MASGKESPPAASSPPVVITGVSHQADMRDANFRLGDTGEAEWTRKEARTPKVQTPKPCPSPDFPAMEANDCPMAEAILSWGFFYFQLKTFPLII